MNLFNYLLAIFDVEAMIRYGGLLLIWLIVFGTTGLFFCFFIPTGAFLFTAGIYTATGDLGNDIYTVCGLLVLASVLGNMAGYGFGLKTGPLLYNRKDSTFFRQQHLTTAKAFYEKHGWMALSLGLYLPVIRTFSPIVAGIIKLPFRRFFGLTVAGSFLWILSFVLAGYAVGRLPLLRGWLNYIVLGFVFLVTIPLIFWVAKELKRMRKQGKGDR